MESDKEQEPDPSEGAGPSNRSQLDSNNESEETKQNKNRKFSSRNYRRSQIDSDTEEDEIETEVPGKRSKSDSPRNDDTQMDVENLPSTLPSSEMEANPERESSPDLNDADGEVVLADQNSPSDHEIDAVGPNLNSSDDDSSLSSSILSPLLYILGGRRTRYSSTDSTDSEQNTANKKKIDEFTKELLEKEKPKHNWNSCLEIKNREINGNQNSYNKLFEMRRYGALITIEQLELMAKLNTHHSCVNCLNFNKTGEFLVSGSDDLRIVLWKWSVEKPKRIFRTSHTKNIFQTKFVEENSYHFKVVSASADGNIFLSTIPTNGNEITTKKLFTHSGAVHKLSIKGDGFITCGEDGKVMRYDLRAKSVNQLVLVRDKARKIPLFSISTHPFEEKFIVSGRDTSVSVYDLRNCKKPIKKFCPKVLTGKKYLDTYISCAVYNYNGTEILASYNDDFIYLFDSSNQNDDITGQNFMHRYQGHYNSATIKGVNFFGPRSEFIVSGSDCGNIYFWSKEEEAIVQWMSGDEEGVVNVLEPHPHIPILATSGLDRDIKIWIPSNENAPNKMEGLEKCIRKNCRLQMRVDVDDGIPAEIRNAFLRRYTRQLESRLRGLHGDLGDNWMLGSDDSSNSTD